MSSTNLVVIHFIGCIERLYRQLRVILKTIVCEEKIVHGQSEKNNEILMGTKWNTTDEKVDSSS